MKALCLLTLFIGFMYFSFGLVCLMAPAFGYRPALDSLGRLSLDEIGVYAHIAGAILWGTSVIALINDSNKKTSD
jgi:hypothetical protein